MVVTLRITAEVTETGKIDNKFTPRPWILNKAPNENESVLDLDPVVDVFFF